MSPFRIRIAMLALATLGGCAHVPAWERETLSHPAMKPQSDPEGDAMKAHVAGAREAALDPGASSGGGCGCN